MFVRDLLAYAVAASDDREMGVSLISIETGDEIALVFDVTADINAYGELILRVAVEP
jgi:hypothetical protein